MVVFRHTRVGLKRTLFPYKKRFQKHANETKIFRQQLFLFFTYPFNSIHNKTKLPKIDYVKLQVHHDIRDLNE